ncbi:MAG: hypothetical protein EZS28_041229 [Streblomastix strix]|uniref:Uncharacterized protein n=1 Tax=Streblomastix strix TaxID=222440 RepID=A0A5J4TY98_9EUKA|nr:MAG: hypothetical protein EZS28_041229 [Streblomastix strix]
MCGSVNGVINDQIQARKIINSAGRFTDLGQLFIAQLKGHIDEHYINDFINFPPIFRNLSYQSSKAVIGEYISYYLQFLIDDCHFIIDDIKQLVTFDKHTKFNAFVNVIMNKRIEAIKVKIMDKTIEAHTKQSWMNDRKLADNLYAVQFNPKNCKCNTCLQVAYFTLDNAKYQYLNFIYNFMYKCLDMTKLHFVEGDTDSSYWAISGKQIILNDTNQQQYEDNLHQGFKYFIKGQQFYDANAKYFFPTIDGDKQDEKKLLGLSIENEGDEMIALAPKNYYIQTFKHNQLTDVIKLKGVNLRQNSMCKQDVIDNIVNGKKTQGTNMRLGQLADQLQEGQLSKTYCMSKLIQSKNALTGIQTKMIVLKNSQSCVPFIYGLTADSYIDSL